ncbi:hypothetical protein RND71_022794 [Anisodus tanguticus]|uniref:Lipoxygenase n=1 Tax=Anisodus tanguticus TaxID=243964 RepID=A0AAE1RTZ8_9SOLA|nr:hypothetical protein RND71_022794 [Anisodus tanguticus]
MGIFPPCCAEILEKLLETVCGKQHDVPRLNDSSNTSSIKIKGTVVLRKKNVLNFKDAGSSFLDQMYELFGKRVSLQLISAVHADLGKSHFDLIMQILELRKEILENLLVVLYVMCLSCTLRKPAILEWASTKTWISVEEAAFNITFDWDESIGLPGAFIIKNHHHNQFYLKTVTLEDVPGHGEVHFTYLPCNTPEPLQPYRNEELVNLRGTGSGMLKEWDRVYDYAVYNDLGHDRPVLGGSKDHPYPRRGRTGRPPTKKDSSLEIRLALLSLNIYVPRDERFNHVKFKDFLAYGATETGRVIIPQIASLLAKPFNEFNNFKHVLEFYKDQAPERSKEQFHKFPVRHVIKEDNSAWRTDEEFGREMLAGVNRVIIQGLQEFPPTSKLNPEVYGDQTSKITREQIEKYMDGLTVDDEINMVPAVKYLPHVMMRVLKAIAVNDSGYHQLVSHRLNTHAAIEPFIIATNRQLSVLHPIDKLLQPHFRDTMNINALAWQILINAGGILELTVFPSKGVAVPDPSKPHGLRLLIEDYPYAVDGLEIWSAIETWVDEYCSFYYSVDDMIKDDSELQSWWTEVRNMGHADLKEEPWWPQMQTRAELVHICTIIIWVASALHAAVNFGQYPYAGYLPNHPTTSRRFMPTPGTPEYAELESNHEVAYLKTITAQFQTLLGISLIEMLSMHSSDEINLGQRDTREWTFDRQPRHELERFRDKLVEIENRIMDRNNDNILKNREGPLFPVALSTSNPYNCTSIFILILGHES